MKKAVLLPLAWILSTATAFAGAPVIDSKQIAPTPPVSFGLGWYGAIDGGLNAYQNYRSDRSFRIDNGDDDVTVVDIDRLHKVGAFGGLKLGYVFGTGVVRFAVEEDLYYNGFQSSLRATANNSPAIANSNLDVNSGAFMTNFLIRFAPGNQRFQPYLGLGVGGYYAATGNISVAFGGSQYTVNRSGSNGGFAWQAVAGADYYLNPRLSLFAEYKYVNYHDIGGGNDLPAIVNNNNLRLFGNQNLGQSLVGVGVRYHF